MCRLGGLGIGDGHCLSATGEKWTGSGGWVLGCVSPIMIKPGSASCVEPARHGATFHQSVTLRAVVVAGESIGRDELVADVNGSLKTDESVVRGVGARS
ncbi:MAG: hypothetical protein QOF84_4653 [Streptomyces sp.]|nr:hypothetical protein [Streptomyces sp.]